MKFLFSLLFLCSVMISSGHGGNELAYVYVGVVEENLRFLDGGEFPDNPSSGYPWVTVKVGKRKAVLLCPVGGIGDAVMVFKDGEVLSRKATLGADELSYERVVKGFDQNKWLELEVGKEWRSMKSWHIHGKLRVESAGKLSRALALYFVYQYLKQGSEMMTLQTR